MRIIGIDPAPGKGLSVFDPYRSDSGPVFYSVGARRAKTWFNELVASTNRKVLIGWDAPLSADFSKTYTQRPIEKFLSSKFEKGGGCFRSRIFLLPALDYLNRPPRETFTEGSSERTR